MDANQSRPRARPERDGETGSAEPTSASALPVRPRKTSLAYQGLPLNSKTFRLIQIEPSAQLNDRISCRLAVVSFGARPKYQALSYVWGKAKAIETIDVNGVAFQVGINLLGALRFLRSMQKNPVSNKDGFWIDAICINQSEVDEKNAQLGLMEHIYSRASSVLVWLGENPRLPQPAVEKQEKSVEPPNEALVTDKEKSMLVEKAVSLEKVALLRNPYWDRLWILQELGRAQRIFVCLPPKTLPWGDFVALLEDRPGFAVNAIGPIRLNSCIVQRRFASLERLLCDHIDAKCSNPLDKIYGLLGLASDGAGFPIDYRKSRFEVWRDTISFISQTVTTDLTAMARLIKELLTRHDLIDSEAHQLKQFRWPTPREKDSKPEADAPASAPKGLTLTVAIMGIITKMGPPAGDCIDEPLQWRDWNHQVQKSFGNLNDKDGALRANDKLLTALLGLDDAQTSNLCSSRAGPHTWGDADDVLVGLAAQDAVQFARPPPLASRVAGRPEPSGTDSSPRLCLLNGAGVSDRPMAPGIRLGLVPGVAKLGDMLCRVRNSSKALLVRTKADLGNLHSAIITMHVRGVATFAEDVGPEPPDYDQRWDSVQTFPMMRVILDAETMLQLIE